MQYWEVWRASWDFNGGYGWAWPRVGLWGYDLAGLGWIDLMLDLPTWRNMARSRSEAGTEP